MRMLLISYDVTDGSTTAALASAIKSVAARSARPLAASWLIETDWSAPEVEAHLAPLLGLDDGLVIQEAAVTPVLSNTVLRWTELETEPLDRGAEVIPWRRGKVAEAA